MDFTLNVIALVGILPTYIFSNTQFDEQDLFIS